MISLTESLLSKKASQVDIGDFVSSDTIKNFIWDQAASDMEVRCNIIGSILKIKCSWLQKTIPLTKYAIDKLNGLKITKIQIIGFESATICILTENNADFRGIEIESDSNIEINSYAKEGTINNITITAPKITLNSPATKNKLKNCTLNCNILGVYEEPEMSYINPASNIITTAEIINQGRISRTALFSKGPFNWSGKFDPESEGYENLDPYKMIGMGLSKFKNKNAQVLFYSSLGGAYIYYCFTKKPLNRKKPLATIDEWKLYNISKRDYDKIIS